MVHRVTGVQTEHEYRRRFLDHDAWAKEQLAAGKLGSAMSDKELLRAAANGEAPARNFREKVGRGAKIAGKHMILESLGPIINPIPDVPGVVALASYGAEVFGQQWWAGLIPPVWQYMHNRYEDMQTSMSAGRKAREIIMRHWNQRIDRLEEKRIEKAAGVFLPRKDLPLAV